MTENHIHCFNIGDDGIGRCNVEDCNATRDFPKEKLTTFTEAERGFIENFKLYHSEDIYHVCY